MFETSKNNSSDKFFFSARSGIGLDPTDESVDLADVFPSQVGGSTTMHYQ